MSEQLLIPFALKVSTKLLVDVSEVVRGKECGCICPSCKTPLIARQGEIKEWHFAHASKGVYSNTQNECKYSFWVSIVLMAKQVLDQSANITLPQLIMYSEDGGEYKVTEKTTVEFSDLSIDTTIDSTTVDAAFKLGEYTVVVLFTAPRKNVDRYHEMTNDMVGVLEISLSQANHWLFDANNKGGYTEALKKNIVSNIECKKWIRHPRQAMIEKRHNVSLNLYKTECIFSSCESNFVAPNVASKIYGECPMCGNNLTNTGACLKCKDDYAI